jgi:redox-regulated HSP33 family molecular chaperone
MAKDEIYSFTLKNCSSIVCRAVVLENTLEAMYQVRHYPDDAIRALVSESSAVATAMAGCLPFEGIMILGLHGEGPVYDLNIGVTSLGKISAFADYRKGSVLGDKIPELFGNGFLTLVFSDKDFSEAQYQRSLDLNGTTLAECLMNYYRFYGLGELAVKTAVSADGRRAVAVMMEKAGRPPDEEYDDDIDTDQENEREDLWREAVIAMAAIPAEDMLVLGPQEFLYRALHNLRLKVFDPEDVEFWDRKSEAE